jgi:hypothetical protein
MLNRILFILLLSLAMLPAVAAAFPGDRDTTFTFPDGYVAFDPGTVGNTDEMLFDVVVQPDGKIVAAGRTIGRDVSSGYFTILSP